jgi:hypothetical protein
MKRTNNAVWYTILTCFLVLFSFSCTKRSIKGTFTVKGRYIDTSGNPKGNMEVYVEYVDNAGYVGSYTRERVGSGITDSLGYVEFQCNYHGDVTYKIKPGNKWLTPEKGQILDFGTFQF